MGCDLFKCCFTTTSADTLPEDIRLKWTIFPYGELVKATNNFDQCHCLGKRGFATVYYGKLKDGRDVAVQRFYENKRHVFQHFIEENTILNYLPHKNLVSVYGRASLDNESLLIHEYLSNGTLASYFQGEIQEGRAIPWLTRLDIAIDAANALYYLHSYGIIHRDVKSSNILLDKNFCAKVSNFHLSRKVPQGFSVVSTHVTNDIIGTCGYIDPEYGLHGRLSVKNDVYSFGVVLCELISSKLVKHWVWSEEDSLANLIGRKIGNQALDVLLDPRLGFQIDHKIKQMITAVAELAVQCLQCPQVLRPHMEQVLDTLQGIREGRYEIKPTKAFKIFHPDELEEATNHFETCLGKGGFGAVYYGKLEDGREVAVKRFHDERDKTIKQFRKEIDVLSLLRHQNLVSLYGCSSRQSDKHLLVYEYISNGTLSMHLRGSSSGKLSWLTRLNIAIETAIALVYLHSSGIIHRDVKSSNILLSENFTVKVADFGLSRSLPDYVTHVSTNPAGTHAYIDPDYYETGRVSDKSDVYSFGVVLFEIISSKPPKLSEGAESVSLAKFGVSKMLNKALEELVDPSLGFGSEKNVMEMITAVAELAFQCVQCPKELRPSMKQVLETLEGIKKGTWGFNQIT